MNRGMVSISGRFMRLGLCGLLAIFATGCATRQPVRQVTVARAVEAPVVIPAQRIPAADGYSYPRDAPQIVAKSWILIDAKSGETVAYKNPDQALPVASTQKLLTALVVLDHGGLDSPVTVTAADTNVEPTKLGLRAGESYTRRSVLNAMMVKSCNDAAMLLARSTSGSVEAFAREMNAKAREVGAERSVFVNPHGLPAAGQYSSARDMARVAFQAYRSGTLREMMRMKYYGFRQADGRVTTLETTNKLLKASPYINGMKTGYTVAAGRCLITSAALPSGREYILVQLGSNTRNIFRDAASVLNWANREYPLAFSGGDYSG